MKKILFSLAILSSVLTGSPSAALAGGSISGSIDNSYELLMHGTTNGRTIISGWAFDRNAGGAATVVVKSPTLGGQTVDQFKTNFARPDVAQLYGVSFSNEGFNWVVPARFYTNSAYDFEFYVLDANGSMIKIGTRHVQLTDRGLRGGVDLVSGTTVVGWASDLDGDDPRNQKTTAFVTIDGEQVGMALTDLPRQDVANYWANADYRAISATAGFNIAMNIPAKFRDGKGHTFQVYALEFTQGGIKQIGQNIYRNIDLNGNVQ